MPFIRPCAVLLLLCLLSPADATSQVMSVRGRVSDRATGEPLSGATVMLSSPDRPGSGTVSGLDGSFSFSVVAPGTYVLSVTFIGFAAWSDSLWLSLDSDYVADVRMQPIEARLDELVVETARTDTDRFIAGLETIRPSDLQRIPMPDVSYDLAGYLVSLPGFVTPGDRGGQLFVRGGTPTQNLVLLDGMMVYQPFHIVGFYSVFPADIIAYTDVYAGGFSARYGGRISSVIDIATRNGDKERVRAAGTIAPFLSGLRLEVPVAPGKVSLLLSIRESVIERIAPELIGEELPFHFGDQFGKLHAFLSKTSSLSLTALRSFDEGNISANAPSGIADDRRSTWNNEAYGFRYTYLPAEYPIVSEFAVYFSRLKSRYQLSQDEMRVADTSELAFKINFAYLFGEMQTRFGIFAILNRFEYALGFNQTPRKSAISSGGAFIDGRYLIAGKIRLEPGFRIDSFSHGLETNIAPRFRATFLPRGTGSRHQFSLAWGKYHQQIVGLNNEQDVSDVFTIWAAIPKSSRVPTATHLIAGWNGRLSMWLEMTVEAYRKKLDNIAFPVFSEAVNRLSRFSLVEGEAKGLDIKLEVNRASVYVSLGYSLANVEYFRRRGAGGQAIIPGLQTEEGNPELRFNPPHDRRHQLNVLGQLNRGRNRLSVRWQFGSGLPFTQVNGYYEKLPEFSTSDTSYRTGNGEIFASRSELYGARLPTYHRLDVSYERLFVLERADITLQMGVINVYGRRNIFEYNIFSGDRIDQLPLIPSVGLKVELN